MSSTSQDQVGSKLVNGAAWIAVSIAVAFGLGVIGLGIAGTMILRGWALSTLWGWFVAPVFALPTLGMAQAIGITTIVALMTPIKANEKERNDKPASKTFLKSLVTNCSVVLLTLGIGWIVKHFL
jgi:hypothetical protein